jgi:hypothetical protein
MPRFKPGDRVQIAGDIARFHACAIGVIVPHTEDAASVLNQYQVRLANGTVAVFFDFQLRPPAALHARMTFDSASAKQPAGTRGVVPGRHLRFVSGNLEIDLKITHGEEKSVVGQLRAGAAPLYAVATLVMRNGTIRSEPVDAEGEFYFRDVPAGELTLEVLVPGNAVLATFVVG